MQKNLLSLAVAIALASVFGWAQDGSAQKPGGTLTLGMYSDISNTDLHRTSGNSTSQFGLLIAEGLVEYDEQCNAVPGVAKSWKASPDATEYTFTLRQGVMFHNGRELTAEDVKKSYEHIMDPKTRSPRSGGFKTVKRVEAVDKYTLTFYLTGPDASFLDELVSLVGFITAEESFEAKPSRPIGTGPFEFVEWQPRQHVKLKRFANYWKKNSKGNRLPYVDEVILKPMVDDTVRYTALRTGDVDWIFELPFEQVPGLKKNPPAGVVLAIKPGMRWLYLMLQTQHGPLKDARVRQAIAYALDKKGIMNGLTWGIGSPGTQPYTPGSQWYFPIQDPYAKPDPERARKLLKESGYDKAVKLDTIVRNETIIMNLATLAQAQLKKAGIELQFQVMDRATHQARQEKGDWDVNPGHLAYYSDPDSVYGNYMYGKSPRTNYGRYKNPEYDILIEEARRISDTGKRKELYRKGLELLIRDVPYVFMGHLPVAQAARSYVKNMKTNCRGDVRWFGGGVDHAWIEK